MKTNQIITLGLVAIGAVIVYNKFIKKPTDSSTPEEGEMSNAIGDLQYQRQLSSGMNECCYDLGNAWHCTHVNGPCPPRQTAGGGGPRRPKMDARLGF
jgi:hypothetical protein